MVALRQWTGFSMEKRDRLPAVADDDGQSNPSGRSPSARHLIPDQCRDVLVEDVLLAVGQVLEAAEGFLEGFVAEFEAELGELFAKGMAAGMLAHHQQGRFHL